jgi:hypothetical protein
MLFFGAFTAAVDICGVRDPMAIFALIMGWAGPAVRGLAHWRKQGDRPRGISIQGWSNTMALAALGGAWWWCVLPVAIQLHPAFLLTPLDFPKALRWFGVLLTLCGLLRPIWLAGRHADDGVLNGMILGVGLFIVSASPLVGVLAVACLAAGLSFARQPGDLSACKTPGGSVQDQKEVHRSIDLLVERTAAI